MNKLNENTDSKYRSVPSIMDETNMSRNTVMKIAIEAGALIRYGKRVVRVNQDVFYNYLQA